MSQIPVEDQIIAYFENRLSDDDRAELLHRVSVSPEIRRVFREHEMLRSMALEARGSSVIGAGVEAALFAKINQLAATGSTDKAAGWLPRLRSYSAEAAFVMMALFAMISYRGNEVAETPVIAERAIAEVAEVRDAAEAPAAEEAEDSGPVMAAATSPKPGRAYKFYRSYEPQAITETAPDSEIGPEGLQQSEAPATLSTVPVRRVAASIGGSGNPMRILRAIPLESSGDLGLEVSLTTSSGFFTSPANEGSGSPLGDFRLRAQYEVVSGLHLGVGVQSGHFLHLIEPVAAMDKTGFESIERPMEYERNMAFEAFVKYRAMLPVGNNIPVDFSIGGGFIPNGNTISTELGFQIPVTRSFAFGPSFSLVRVHSNAAQLEAFTPKKSDVPMIISGSEQRNTIQGAINVGLSYRF